MDIYEHVPEFTSENFCLRQVRREDRDDLLKVYSDRKSVPIFNSDNCTGDFYMTRAEDMERCIDFWLLEYAQRYYVRWSIVALATDEAVGTIELFHRTAGDCFNHVGLLRLDLRSDYETAAAITEILTLLFGEAFDLFEVHTMATKIPPVAAVRRAALEKMGFVPTGDVLRGHDGTAYGDYYTLTR